MFHGFKKGMGKYAQFTFSKPPVMTDEDIVSPTSLSDDEAAQGDAEAADGFRVSSMV